MTIEQIEASCALLCRRDIKVAGYFQFYSAWEESDRLFWETPQDCRRTIQWAVDLGKRGLLHYMFTDVATPRPGTPLCDVALKHRLLKMPAKEPFAYLAEGMNLPGVPPFPVTATRLQANYVKTRMAIENGHVNLPVLFSKARKSLRV